MQATSVLKVRKVLLIFQSQTTETNFGFEYFSKKEFNFLA